MLALALALALALSLALALALALTPTLTPTLTDLQAACEANPLDERAARFYVAGVFRALSCVHEADVVCRACSLDAIMLDAKGYPQLVDLSLSKSVTNGRTHTLCGTRDYLAPEIVKMAGHGVEADYWALGVLANLS